MSPEERVKAVAILEKEFGPQWQTIAQMLGTENLRQRVGKDLSGEKPFCIPFCRGKV